MPQPSIAVITPVRNGLPYLREAIERVRAQQYGELEIVVVDDGSTDQTMSLAIQAADNDPRVRLIHFVEQNRGISVASNGAFDEA